MTDGVTPVWWSALMHAISLEGVRVPVALKRFGISPRAFRKLIRAEPRLAEHFARCKTYAKRRRFPLLVVDDMLSELARTNASFKAVVLHRGYTLTAYKRLVDLIWRTPEWRQSYLASRRAKVTRNRARFLSVPDDELVALGKSGISREAFRIHSLTSMSERRAAAKRYRAARAAEDPLYAARQRAKRRRPA